MRVFIRVMLVVFVCEAFIMFLLWNVPLHAGWQVILDALLLALLTECSIQGMTSS